MTTINYEYFRRTGGRKIIIPDMRPQRHSRDARYMKLNDYSDKIQDGRIPRCLVDKPPIEDQFKQGEFYLRWLLFTAVSGDERHQEVKKLTAPLAGYTEGQEVTLAEIGLKLLEIAGLSGTQYASEPKRNILDPNDCFRVTNPQWTYWNTNNAITFLAGIEGILGLLAWPGIPLSLRVTIAKAAFTPGLKVLVGHNEVFQALTEDDSKHIIEDLDAALTSPVFQDFYQIFADYLKPIEDSKLAQNVA